MAMWNRVSKAKNYLKKSNIGFQMCNMGLHLILYLRKNQRTIDFMPTTGRWYNRITKEKGNGLASLKAHIESIQSTTKLPGKITATGSGRTYQN